MRISVHGRLGTCACVYVCAFVSLLVHVCARARMSVRVRVQPLPVPVPLCASCQWVHQPLAERTSRTGSQVGGWDGRCFGVRACTVIHAAPACSAVCASCTDTLGTHMYIHRERETSQSDIVVSLCVSGRHRYGCTRALYVCLSVRLRLSLSLSHCAYRGSSSMRILMEMGVSPLRARASLTAAAMRAGCRSKAAP
jgi:hypothetical protein